MEEKVKICYVNCTEDFLQAAGLGTSYVEETPLEVVRNFVNNQYLLRFLVQLVALLPLAVCVAVSLTKGIDNYCLRLFCWNCVFVNVKFAMFLGYRLVALKFIYVVKHKCYSEGGAPQFEFVKNDATSSARAYIDDFIYPAMNKWCAYSVSISLVFVRCANYCACVSPLRFTEVLSLRKLWLAAVFISDLFGVAVAMFDNLAYFDIAIDLRIQALIIATFALGIWLSELVISLLTVVQVVKYLGRRSVATKQDSRNISRITSILLFSISPAIQLLPFVYTDVNSAWEDMKFYWFMQCMKKFGDVASLPMDKLNELTEQCDVEHGYTNKFLCGFNWKLEVGRLSLIYCRNEDLRSHLEAKLSCTVNDPQKPVHVKAQCRLRLLHATDDDLEWQWTGSMSYDPDAHKKFVLAEDKWLASVQSDILSESEGYLVDDTLRFLCHIDAQTIGTQARDGPRRKRPYEERYEDITLVMGDRRIKANKGILAVHCEFFAAAFYGKHSDRNEEERELPDVDPDDFEKFNAAIYPPQKELNEENVYAVVSLADRFDAKSLLDKCEEFLLEEVDAADACKGLSVYAGLDDLKSKFLTAMLDKEQDVWMTPEGLRKLGTDNMELVLQEYKNRRAQS